MVENKVTELVVYLSDQKAILENVVSCLEKEQTAIIEEDADKLKAAIEGKAQYIDELALVEEKRSKDYPGITLSQLEEEGHMTPELEQIGNELRDLVDEAQRLQRLNRVLTQRSREYAEKMIALLQGESKATYRSDGKKDDPKGSSTIIDSSV